MLENENLNEPQKPQLNIGAVIARFIPFVGLIITDRTKITKLFVLYHFVSSCMIGVYTGVKIAMSQNVL
jgi:hypothetical protein